MDKNLNTQNPQVSVVIPAYNTERYIGRTLNSLARQTFNNFEIIVIDDNSTDNTVTVVKEHQARDIRIILISNDRNFGPCISRNRGMALARGKYIAILDSDDLSEPNRLAVQLEYLETHPKVTLVGSQGVRIDENDRIIGNIINASTDPAIIKYRLITENNLIHSSVFFRRDEIMSIGGYDKKYQGIEDFDLYSRLLKNNFILLNLPDRLVSYRQRRGSILSSPDSRQLALKNVYSLIYSNIKEYVLMNEEVFSRYYHAYLLKEFGAIPLVDLWLSLRLNRRILKAFMSKEKLTAEQRLSIITAYRQNRKWNIKRYLVSKFRVVKQIFRLNK